MTPSSDKCDKMESLCATEGEYKLVELLGGKKEFDIIF